MTQLEDILKNNLSLASEAKSALQEFEKLTNRGDELTQQFFDMMKHMPSIGSNDCNTGTARPGLTLNAPPSNYFSENANVFKVQVEGESENEFLKMTRYYWARVRLYFCMASVFQSRGHNPAVGANIY
jgi:hypothetical protein